MLLGNGEVAAEQVGIQVHLDAFEHLPGRLAHAASMEKAAANRFASEEQVLGDCEVRDERDLLEYRGDSGRHRTARTVEIKDAAGEMNFAGVRSINAGEQLHQSRLAGAVLARDRMNRPGPAREGHGAQRLRRAETLGDVSELDQWRSRVGTRSLAYQRASHGPLSIS